MEIYQGKQIAGFPLGKEEIKRSGGGKPLLSVRTHDYKFVSSCHKCTNLCIMYNAHVIYVYISCYKYVVCLGLHTDVGSSAH